MAPFQDLPKLRADLIFTSRDAAEGGAVFVVKDPSTGRFFRFREPERFIAEQLDGSTPPEVVRERAEARFRSPLSEEELNRFVEGLRRSGLLEGTTLGHPAPGRKRGSLLYLRLKALDPDRFLSRLVPKIQWLFTREVAFLSVTLMMAALAITLANGPAISRGMPPLHRPEALALIWVTLIGITVVHEFAHGVACKHFGGSVHEMGFLLLYFQPAMYCNVSDAWLLPEKWKRIWVTFAGAYIELCFWALATLVWRWTEPATLPHRVALVVMVTLGVKTLINLNPLIKLDGYYLLCDALEMPNLRRRAFQYLRSKLGLRSGAEGQALGKASPRERRIYLAYAVLAAGFSLWFLGLVSVYTARFLVGRYQGWGFIAFAGLLLVLFQGPLRAAGVRIRSAIHAVRQGTGSMSRSRRLLAGSVLVLVALLLIRVHLRVAGEFSILPARNADVRAEVEGAIERVFVREGEVVRKGAPIARLSDRSYRAELEKARMAIAEKSAKRKMLDRGATHEEIDLAKATVAKAKERSEYAQRQSQRAEALYQQQLMSLRELEGAREEAAVRDKELKEAEGGLRVLLAGARGEEIEAAQAEIDQLEAQQRYLQDQLDRLLVVSPIDGIVATPKLEERIGEYVKVGDLIVKVLELKVVSVEIAVSEKEISEVKVGQDVVLRARAMPWKNVRGRVTSIAPVVTTPSEDQDLRTVTVTSLVENPSLALKPQMTGMAKIYCGKRPLLSVLLRRLSQYLRVEFWSWW